MRTVYVVSYDISDPKRLRRVFETVKSYGERVQLSVFVCKLSKEDLVRLHSKLRGEMNLNEDQVLFFRLGPAGSDVGDRVVSLGRPLTVPLGPGRALIL